MHPVIATPRVRLLTLVSFLLAFVYFAGEVFIFNTAPLTFGTVAPLAISSEFVHSIVCHTTTDTSVHTVHCHVCTYSVIKYYTYVHCHMVRNQILHRYHFSMDVDCLTH